MLVRRVRTFADDLRRVQGNPASGPAETASDGEGAASPVPTASASQQQSTEKVSPPTLAPEPVATTDSELLDIRKEASGVRDPIVVRETRRERWSLMRALGELFNSWLNDRRRDAVRILGTAHPRKHATSSPEPEADVLVPQPTVNAPTASTPSETLSANTLLEEEETVERIRTFAHDIALASEAIEPTSTKRAPEIPANLPTAPVVPPSTPEPFREMHTPEAAPRTETRRDESEREAALARMLAARIRTAATASPATSEPPQATAAATPPAQPIPAEAIPEYPPIRRNDLGRDTVPQNRSVADLAVAEAVRRRHSETNAGMSPRPFVIAGMLMLFIIVLGGPAVFWFANRSPQEAGTIARIPTFIAIDNQVPARFSEDRTELLTTLASAVEASVGVVQVYPTHAGASGSAAVATSEFMRTLNPRAPGSLLRSFEEEMMAGAVDGEPFLILKTAQYPTTLAGMLDWEPNMSADLAPLFGEPIRRTLDTNARTSDGTSSASFTDSSTSGTDTRVLVDAVGNERILYALPDEQTLIITTSRAALAELLNRLR